MARRQENRYIQYYVGTAAPKLIPQLPKKNKTSLPKAYKQQSYTVHVDPLALGGIVVSVVMLVLMIVGMVQLHGAKQELTQMTSYVNTLQTTHVELENKYEEKYDIETIEKAALGLGMIPIEEAEHITIRVPVQEEQSTGVWERIGSFLTGLFA